MAMSSPWQQLYTTENRSDDSTELALVFDTETTGLTLHPYADLRLQPKVIEFGGALVSLRDGGMVDEFSILVNPGQPLEEIITKITGLTDETLAPQPTFDVAWPQIRNFMTRASCIVAHNLPFDKTVMQSEFRRLGIVDNAAWPVREMCTVGVYTEQWGKMPTLKALYEKVMGKPLEQHHRALSDVHALVAIIQAERLWELM